MALEFWARFGFKADPYDTSPLSANPGALLSAASRLMIGLETRKDQARLLHRALDMGGRIVVEGEIGVGKTAFVNFHRHHKEYVDKNKQISPVGEIQVVPEWTVREDQILCDDKRSNGGVT